MGSRACAMAPVWCSIAGSTPASTTEPLELHLECGSVGPAAKVDPGPREVLIQRQVAMCVLIPDFAADGQRSDREPHAANHQRPRRGAAADETAVIDRTVVEDEVADLAV